MKGETGNFPGADHELLALYQQFDVERERERKRIEARDLGDAIRRAQDQRAFLVDYVTKNSLASEVARFVSLIKQIDPALEKPSLDQLQRLNGQIELAIREANLDEAFRAAQERRAKPGGPADATAISRAAIYAARARHSAKTAERLC